MGQYSEKPMIDGHEFLLSVAEGDTVVSLAIDGHESAYTVAEALTVISVFTQAIAVAVANDSGY